MISVIGNCVTTVVAGRTFPNCSERAKAEAISAENKGRCTTSEIPPATDFVGRICRKQDRHIRHGLVQSNSQIERRIGRHMSH